MKLAENLNVHILPEAVLLLLDQPLIVRSLSSRLFCHKLRLWTSLWSVKLRMQNLCCWYVRSVTISCWLNLLILYLPLTGFADVKPISWGEYEHLTQGTIVEVKRSIQSIFQWLCQVCSRFGAQHRKGLTYLSASWGLRRSHCFTALTVWALWSIYRLLRQHCQLLFSFFSSKIVSVW